MDYNAYIERNPNILLGKPVLKGTRITVEQIIRKMANGYSIDQLKEAYPHLSSMQIQAALDYAADVISNEVVLNWKMIIIDENVEEYWIKLISQNGYPFISIRNSHSGISDIDVINIAKEHRGIILTEDKDFGELVFA